MLQAWEERLQPDESAAARGCAASAGVFWVGPWLSCRCLSSTAGQSRVMQTGHELENDPALQCGDVSLPILEEVSEHVDVHKSLVLLGLYDSPSCTLDAPSAGQATGS